MTLVQVLEDFGSKLVVPPTPTDSEEADAQQLESFDEGYRAGWDDAIKAKDSDSTQITSDFAQTLQDLSFTYHEAHAQMLASVAPLFEELMQSLLPQMARDTLGAHVADKLTELARDLATGPVNIMVAPGQSEAVNGLIAQSNCSLPVTVSETDTLIEGQAELQFENQTAQIDLADVTQQLTSAVRAVLYEKQERVAHG